MCSQPWFYLETTYGNIPEQLQALFLSAEPGTITPEKLSVWLKTRQNKNNEQKSLARGRMSNLLNYFKYKHLR